MTMPAPAFRRVRSGYEPESVDRYLHQVGNRLGAAEARANDAEAALSAREAELESALTDLATVRRSRPDLVADEVVADARREAEELTAEARREAAQIRLRAQGEAERLAQRARAESEKFLARARHEASVVDERARQEFFWRRRQLQVDADELRVEQERINRQRAAIKEQLNSLSALAMQQATSAPAVELMLDDDLVNQAAAS
jgi:cell division septum initiation protein DivIVA